MNTVRHLINGTETAAAARRGPVFDPATGAVTKEVAFASAAEVDAAVAAAAAALPAWRETSLIKRADVFFRLRQLLTERTDELAAIVTSEHGKVLSDAAGEVSRGIENVEFAAGLVHLLKGERSEQVARGVDVHSVKQPVGVVAAITPFNFPVMVPLWMVASAIACGNTVVLKPSEKDPSAAVWLARLFHEAGLPDGVLNVVHGDREAVDALLESPRVQAVSFVGSTPIARAIYQRASAAGKRVQALGGAKNHMVVMPDADIDAAADAAVSAAYGSAGERCMAVSVLVAVGDIADDLVAAIARRIDGLSIGPGTDPASAMGPLITAEHRDRVASYVAGAPGEGARVVVDGTSAEFDGDGFFLGASLIDDVTPGMRVYDDEIFGPVLSVVRVGSYAEAVALVNANAYGNGTAIFTRDGGTARQYEFDIEVGMVGVNVPIPVPVGAYSFGGWKDSLFGDAHIYGPESVHFYTRSKVVTTRWPDHTPSQIDLGFPSNH
ncbi:Putative 3-oxopropanoate dehydrogenase [Microbacterium sp. Nx66]|uniref:CoA-acylating methylmalonate-semialdehyde dehydrogenase n=1 Tax=unclassified Microbacterium TaxID=2609290 RepID=UPI00165703B7|nr:MULTISPECIES: CoA-acylating methylmalonate-semialdehyde dehydrogenase [unclassified Microbacterium]MDH5134570.1 CoA-acylating methylmalonate-semialdehyde dehydrogenase [Microbacterium sp. RD10]MDH5138124.1 CoA-acylating methylmalonate-semialdehyde dehydrogenase [Microbacterium sp. RD11]MDH5146264.1 CoA-acylating methylmalonate-semialdehyde dehydrogenase [Microbacterium sp. RD12]MDH5156422.1 CoA-acylating methylmalonate-semialdehyde dehydrogenase [Microbacterium sp. RD06]MDH5167657.1 CoA-acy